MARHKVIQSKRQRDPEGQRPRAPFVLSDGSRRWAYGFLFLLAAVLALVRLDSPAFWEDEAETAFVARAHLRTGEFSGWDGRNLHAYGNGAAMDAQLRYVNPPFQYAVTAASFRVLGASTRSSRLPFVLAGLAGLAVFGLVLREDYREFPMLRLYAFAALALCVTFPLYVRQCRYYALVLLFSLLAYYFYRRCLRTARLFDFVGLAVAAVLLFYSHYLVAAAFLLALAGIHVLFHWRASTRAFWIGVALAVVLFALATVPHAIEHRIWARPDMERGGSWWSGRLTLLWWHVRDMNWLVCLPWTLALGLFLFLWRARKQSPLPQIVWTWVALATGYLGLLALLGPNPYREMQHADLRFFFMITPFLAGLAGAFFWFVHQRSALAAVALLLLTSSSNLLALNPANPGHLWLLPAYLREIYAHYPTGYEAAAEYLRQHARQDDLVYACPRYSNFALMFNAGDHVRFCGFLNDKTTLPRQTLQRLNAPLWEAGQFPDWVVMFGRDITPEHAQVLNFYSRPHSAAGGPRQFRYELAETLPVFCYTTGRPELFWHTFGPMTKFNPQTQGVYIFRRTEAKPR